MGRRGWREAAAWWAGLPDSDSKAAFLNRVLILSSDFFEVFRVEENHFGSVDIRIQESREV